MRNTILTLAIFLLTTTHVLAQKHQTCHNDGPLAGNCGQSFAPLSETGPTSSPIQPRKSNDTRFIENSGSGLDTGCTFRPDGPLVISLPVNLPWFTYPAIEALSNWDLSDKRVFEYGSGFSTLFWASRAKEVVSVEHDREWYEKIAKLAPQNVRLILAPIDKDEPAPDPSPETREQFNAYAAAIDGRFNIIVVDGYARSRVRYLCAQAALQHLDPNGLIILDNSDWLPASALLLRRAGLIEVDLSGPVPGNNHHQTTSFFFSREFNFQPASSRQPKLPIGGRPDNWEKNLEAELLAEEASAVTKG